MAEQIVQPEQDPRELYVYLDANPQTGDAIVTDERALNELWPVPTVTPTGERVDSRRAWLNATFGTEETDPESPEGTWFFDTSSFAAQNEINRAAAEAQSKLAGEAFMNMLAGERYTLDGQNMDGRLRNQPRKPDMGYVRVAPEAMAAHLDRLQAQQ